MSKYRIKLFVTGQTSRSQAAIANLKEMLEKDFAGEYDLEVIDVLERPGLAEDEKILATPALIRELPEPIHRVIGDLSDREQVLLGLDLQPSGEREDGPGGGSA